MHTLSLLSHTNTLKIVHSFPHSFIQKSKTHTHSQISKVLPPSLTHSLTCTDRKVYIHAYTHQSPRGVAIPGLTTTCVPLYTILTCWSTCVPSSLYDLLVTQKLNILNYLFWLAIHSVLHLAPHTLTNTHKQTHTMCTCKHINQESITHTQKHTHTSRHIACTSIRYWITCITVQVWFNNHWCSTHTTTQWNLPSSVHSYLLVNKKLNYLNLFVHSLYTQYYTWHLTYSRTRA